MTTLAPTESQLGASLPTDPVARAQEKRGRHDIEAGVLDWHSVCGPFDEGDVDRRGVGGDPSQSAEMELRFDRDDLRHRGRAVREVQAVAGTDLDEPTARAGEHLIAVRRRAIGRRGSAEARVDAAKDRMPDLRCSADHHRSV